MTPEQKQKYNSFILTLNNYKSPVLLSEVVDDPEFAHQYNFLVYVENFKDSFPKIFIIDTKNKLLKVNTSLNYLKPYFPKFS